MGIMSREIIAEWGPDRFASGVRDAVSVALASTQKKVGLLDQLMLGFLAG